MFTLATFWHYSWFVELEDEINALNKKKTEEQSALDEWKVTALEQGVIQSMCKPATLIKNFWFRDENYDEYEIFS